MQNQSFTTHNFRRIFDYENRKGRFIEGMFFPEVSAITEQLKNCSSEIRQHIKKRPTLNAVVYEKKKAELNEKKEDLKNSKESLLTEELDKISGHITSGNFRFKVEKSELANKKFEIYRIENNPFGYFAIKQLQNNLRNVYKVKQNSRHKIISQLIRHLDDGFPKIIYKTDIVSFYESISTERIINKISKDHLLTAISKKLLIQLITGYQQLSSNEKEGVQNSVSA